MSATVNNDQKVYEKLIKRFPLRPIRNVKQNDIAAEICDMLTDKLESLTPAERDYLEVLTDLIVKFESQWQDEALQMSPRDLIQYLMEQNDLAQKDLVPEFGSPSRVSEFLKGERRLSLEQAKRLADRFRVNIAALIEKSEPSGSIRQSPMHSTASLQCRNVSFRNLLGRRQLTYWTFLDTCVRYASEDEDVARRFKRRITEEYFSQIYSKVFKSLGEVVLSGSYNRGTRILLSNEHDVDIIMSTDPVQVLADFKFAWFKQSEVESYGDFLGLVHRVAHSDSKRHPEFWQRPLDRNLGPGAFAKFALDIHRELAGCSHNR